MKRILPLVLLLNLGICMPQELKVYHITHQKITLDGKLEETPWQLADSIYGLTMVEPEEGASPTFRTSVKILADNENLYIGVKCYDPEPEKIIYFSKIYDARLRSEDMIKFVLDTNLDGRTGYIFAVNPAGTRYDALIANFGEGENPGWDGIWNASTRIEKDGWTAEIIIPVKTLSFAPNATEWGFNFERRIQRKLETDRWTGAKRDYKIGHVIHAGRITNLPRFSLGQGTIFKVSGIARMGKVYGERLELSPDYSLDITQKITPDVTAQLTLNTDFAETEVDARRTNLTRFPLFFPEKREFFLEGSDIFYFGIGLGHDIIPFFTRRIGLYEGKKVPLAIGGKINGKVKGTNFGALITQTKSVKELVPASTMGAFRIKQNIFEESTIGLLSTFGDPEGKKDIWLAGLDFTYKTSTFRGDKNFLTGVWALYNNNPYLKGDNTAIGIKIDYPNDLWDIAFVAKRIGDAFIPSLGFVPRPGVITYRLGIDYMPRPRGKVIRQFFFESGLNLTTDLKNRWETYRIFTAPIHFLLESGDRFEFNIMPVGERLDEDFPISDNVTISPGKYHWRRYRLELGTATKRKMRGKATWWFGSFYNGKLDRIELSFSLRPSGNADVQLNYEKNIVRLPAGNFARELFRGKLQLSFSPDFELSSFIQYDNESHSLGTNTRIRWRFSMLGDIFIVYNHNIVKEVAPDIWRYDSNEFIVKLRYGIWL